MTGSTAAESRRDTVLRILKERDGFVSGQELCDMLGISRTAVWKIITGLKKDGYVIEAVTNRGYCLLGRDGTGTFDGHGIEKNLHTSVIAGTVVFRAETGSTNQDAMELADRGAAHGTLVCAAMQSAGRGRRGRTWISPADANTYFSLLLRPAFAAEKAPMLTLIAALAVAEAIREQLDAVCADGGVPCEAGIKWPNDIVIRRKDGAGSWKKICGILTEMRMEDRDIRDVIIGIGINVNQSVIPEEIGASATSMLLETGREFDRALLTASFADHFEPLYERFLGALSMEPFRQEYESFLVSMGKRVRILDPAGEYEGTAAGIDANGALLVIPDGSGAAAAISSGEVSVRGVEGYI